MTPEQIAAIERLREAVRQALAAGERPIIDYDSARAILAAFDALAQERDAAVRGCPFDRPDCDIDVETPCPMCGECGGTADLSKRINAKPLLLRRAEQAEAERDAAVLAMENAARARGEAEGKLAASEMAGVVEGWRERALKAERERDAAVAREAQIVAWLRAQEAEALLVIKDAADLDRPLQYDWQHRAVIFGRAADAIEAREYVKGGDDVAND